MQVGTIPVNEYVEDHLESNGQFSRTFLAYPKYHRHEDESFHETDCTIQENFDSEWDWKVEEGIWSFYVKRDGTFRSVFREQTITRKPVGIGFYNTRTRQCIEHQCIALTNWSVIVSGDTIEWKHSGTGAIFRIRYVHDRASIIIVIPQALQDEINTKRPEWPEFETYVGIIYEADIDFLTEDIDTENFIWYTSGSSLIRIGGQFVRHKDLHEAEGDDLEAVSHLVWRKRNAYLPTRGLYVESCGLDAFTSADGAIIFHDTDTFQQGADGYSGCEDTYLDNRHQATNYGNSDTIYVSADYFGYNIARGLIRFDLSGELPTWPDPGVVFSYAQVSLYCYDTKVNGASFDCMMAGVWKGWEEHDSNWNRFDVNGNLAWDVPGCDHKSNYVHFNSLSGYGYDRTSDYVQVNIDESYEDAWVNFDLGYPSGIGWHLTRQYQDGFHEGFVFGGDWPGFNDYSVYFRSSEYSVDVTKRPKLTITWSVSSSTSSYSSCSSSYSHSSFS